MVPTAGGAPTSTVPPEMTTLAPSSTVPPERTTLAPSTTTSVGFYNPTKDLREGGERDAGEAKVEFIAKVSLSVPEFSLFPEFTGRGVDTASPWKF